MAQKAPATLSPLGRICCLARGVAFVLLAVLAAGAAQAKDRYPDLNWVALETAQREILAPLADEWDQLDSDSRKRWLGVAIRYPTMTPIGQKRVKTRIKKWAALTPQQRAEARARYKLMLLERKMKRLRREWQRYQALSIEERQRLAAPEKDKRKTRRTTPKSSPAPATGNPAQ